MNPKGSHVHLLTSIKKLKDLYNALSEKQRTGTKGANLINKIRKMSSDIKEMESGIASFNPNSHRGNYKEGGFHKPESQYRKS